MGDKKRKHPLFEVNVGEPMLRRRSSFSEGYHRTDEEKKCMRMLLETAEKFVPNDKKRARRSDR